MQRGTLTSKEDSTEEDEEDIDFDDDDFEGNSLNFEIYMFCNLWGKGQDLKFHTSYRWEPYNGIQVMKKKRKATSLSALRKKGIRLGMS